MERRIGREVSDLLNTTPTGGYSRHHDQDDAVGEPVRPLDTAAEPTPDHVVIRSGYSGTGDVTCQVPATHSNLVNTTVQYLRVALCGY